MLRSITPLPTNSPEYKGIAELNLIYEAGLDRDSRPILILSAHRLPDPSVINYDLILANEFVESDYTLVFFSAPANYRPSWWWLLKAYRALDRRYKKNLKALYVLHLTRSYRIIFDLANRVTSPKFAKKLHYISRLEDLKQLVSLPATLIPDAVSTYDKSIPGARLVAGLETMVVDTSSHAFGRTLSDLAGMEGWDLATEPAVPSVVRQLVEHLVAHGKKSKRDTNIAHLFPFLPAGLDKEGLFRKSPSSEELNEVKAQLNHGQPVDFNLHDVDVAAALLKVFCRDLPTPVFSVDQSLTLCSLVQVKEQLGQQLAASFEEKPFEWRLLCYLLKFLHQVTDHAETNRMTAHNLAVVFAPNLIRAEQNTINLDTAMASQEVAMASATLYLKQMNQGISLLQVLITDCHDLT
ncbi:Rho GTPase activation protein [Hesseltinella vesiculosa]|uniref:Rho GTPase activation protein n=1 Tax=Hesseltinella vesiculosa TaxID=101127 RepID=A0A1X2GUM2_9FUNG|nr:Rho GTPase activation protein [Hesseltinella vesiculosa]